MNKDIKAKLKQANVLSLFESLAISHQNEYLKWINEAKKVETRQKRIAKTIKMIKEK